MSNATPAKVRQDDKILAADRFKRRRYTSSLKVGGIHHAEKDFTRNVSFFTDAAYTKPQAREIKPVIKDFIDIDILGEKKREWNDSTSLPRDREETDTRMKCYRIRKGLYDETLKHPKPYDPPTYVGVDTRDVYHHGWDSSIVANSNF